jgi:hypothetical protein
MRVSRLRGGSRAGNLIKCIVPNETVSHDSVVDQLSLNVIGSCVAKTGLTFCISFMQVRTLMARSEQLSNLKNLRNSTTQHAI